MSDAALKKEGKSYIYKVTECEVTKASDIFTSANGKVALLTERRGLPDVFS